MNGEIRSAIMRSRFGSCVMMLIAGFAATVIGVYGFVTFLKWQAARNTAPSRPGGAAVSIRFDFSEPLVAVLVITVIAVAFAGIRLFGSRPLRRRAHLALGLAGAGVTALQPGLLLGALLTAVVCWERPRPFRFVLRGCLLVPGLLLLLLGAWHWAWPLLLWRHQMTGVEAIAAAVAELLLGSAWLRLYMDMTSSSEAEMKLVKRGQRLQARFEKGAGPDEIRAPIWQRTRRHPAGYIDLGMDRVARRTLRVPLRCLRRHGSIVGVTGWGKTVAIARVIDGVLSQPQPWAVLIVDCKGAGLLRDTAQQLATAFCVPFQEVNPGRPGSLRYDITQLGGPAELADKLTAAFPSTPDSAIYRDTSYHALVHAAAAHFSVNGKVQLDDIEAALDKTALGTLAGQVRELAPGTHTALLGIAERMGNSRQTTSSAINGMASRLGALRAGRFGEVLDGGGPALDLEKAAAEPGVTYISLPALASTADLRMMGRVLLSDLKLLAHLRLDPARRPRPCLVVLDEFSALDDPDNVRDLLRQAREPELPCLTASQSLPEPGGCRSELLQAGVQVFLKCLPEDAEQFAMLAGTVIGRALVHEVEFFPLRSRKGAIGEKERFRCHPRWFRLFANPGLCGVRFDQVGELPTATIAQIYQNEPDATLAGRAWCWLTERLRVSRRGPDVRSGAGSGEPVAKPPPAWQAGTEDEAEGSDSTTSRNGDGPRFAHAPERSE